MKTQDLSCLTEDQLFEIHCESSHELADLSRAILNIQRQSRKLAKTLDKVDMEFQAREAKVLKLENKLN